MIIEKIGREIELHAHQAFDKKVIIQDKYSWSNDDARLTVFNKINRLLASINLGYFLMHSYIQKEEWWQKNQYLEATKESIENAANDFEMLFRIGLIHNLLYCVESSFRIYMRTLDPTACNNGRAEFQSIYRCLLKILNLQTSNLELLDLLRNIRNTMHNNGLFFPSNDTNQTVTYKGTSYNFEVGKPNDFVKTELIVELIPDLITLIESVVTTSPLVGISYIKEIS